MKEFKSQALVTEASVVSVIDDIIAILPLERSPDIVAIGTAIEWLQERLGENGIPLNWRISQALLANEILPENLAEEQRKAVDSIGLTVSELGR